MLHQTIRDNLPREWWGFFSIQSVGLLFQTHREKCSIWHAETPTSKITSWDHWLISSCSRIAHSASSLMHPPNIKSKSTSILPLDSPRLWGIPSKPRPHHVQLEYCTKKYPSSPANYVETPSQSMTLTFVRNCLSWLSGQSDTALPLSRTHSDSCMHFARPTRRSLQQLGMYQNRITTRLKIFYVDVECT